MGMKTFVLTDVEAGFARVSTPSGRSIGKVAREKHGSTRTGTRWSARSSWRGLIGYADTRAAAAQFVADEYAAFIGSAS